jgi:hypothetical protein
LEGFVSLVEIAGKVRQGKTTDVMDSFGAHGSDDMAVAGYRSSGLGGDETKPDWGSSGLVCGRPECMTGFHGFFFISNGSHGVD